jgi:hypothetical protein
METATFVVTKAYFRKVGVDPVPRVDLVNELVVRLGLTSEQADREVGLLEQSFHVFRQTDPGNGQDSITPGPNLDTYVLKTAGIDVGSDPRKGKAADGKKDPKSRP